MKRVLDSREVKACFSFTTIPRDWLVNAVYLDLFNIYFKGNNLRNLKLV